MRPLTAREEEDEDEEDAASGLDDEAEDPKEPEGSCRGAGRREGPIRSGYVQRWLVRIQLLYRGDKVGEARTRLVQRSQKLAARAVPSEDA